MEDVILTSKSMNFKCVEPFIFRALNIEDTDKLGRFFIGLSDDSKSKFGPHPLTMEHAEVLCNSIKIDEAQRFVIESHGEIKGYFILDFGIYNEELQRYQTQGLILKREIDPVFALCISDRLQNHGLASIVMPIIINFAKAQDLRRIVLMGGTQERNLLARAFYRKFGFKEYGQFYTEHNQLNNIDMILELNNS